MDYWNGERLKMLIQIEWIIGNQSSYEVADVIKVPEKFLRGDIPYYIFTEPDKYVDNNLGKRIPTWMFVSLNNFPVECDFWRFQRRVDMTIKHDDTEREEIKSKYDSTITNNEKTLKKLIESYDKAQKFYKKQLERYSLCETYIEGLETWINNAITNKSFKKSRKQRKIFVNRQDELMHLKKHYDQLETYLFKETYVSKFKDNMLFVKSRYNICKDELTVKEEMLEEEGIGDIFSTPEGNKIASATRWDRDLNEGDQIKKDYIKPMLACGIGSILTGLIVSLIFVVIIHFTYG